MVMKRNRTSSDISTNYSPERTKLSKLHQTWKQKFSENNKNLNTEAIKRISQLQLSRMTTSLPGSTLSRSTMTSQSYEVMKPQFRTLMDIGSRLNNFIKSFMTVMLLMLIWPMFFIGT